MAESISEALVSMIGKPVIVSMADRRVELGIWFKGMLSYSAIPGMYDVQSGDSYIKFDIDIVKCVKDTTIVIENCWG